MKFKLTFLLKITTLWLFLLVPSGVFAQVGIGTEAPDPTSILDIKSVTKGILVPIMTEAQRDDIGTPANGLFIFNLTEGCFNYYKGNVSRWLSLCGTYPPAEAEITGVQCTQVKIEGKYIEGQILDLSHYMIISITVTKAGTYTIDASTQNGYYFTANGTFPDTGTYNLRLTGVGRPNVGHDAGGGDAVSININNQNSGCAVINHVDKAAVGYSITNVTPQGDYLVGIQLDPATHKLLVEVDVTSVGFWSMSTNTLNGYKFTGSGDFTTIGIQTVELIASGTPETWGINTFSVTGNAPGGGSYTATVNVKDVGYTMDCASAVVNGYYQQAVALSSSNTIVVPVNVTATGSTIISTDTVNGMSFTSGTVNFTTTGVQNVTLTGSGTPTISGINTFTLTGNGAVATCTVKVDVNAQPVAYTINCASIVVSGSYETGTPMGATNTMTLSVNVQYTGAYSLTLQTVNGVTFSGSGNFTATGTQGIVLTASGTPTKGGVFTFNVTNGASTCPKDITFVYRAMNVLGLGETYYQPGTATAAQAPRAILQSTSNFGTSGTVKSKPIVIFNGGTAAALALKGFINTNKIDIIVIGYNYTPNADQRAVLVDFVKEKKGVLIHSQENDFISTAALINAITGGSVAVAGTGTTYVNPILAVDDPTLNGPFGSLAAGMYLGSDVNNSYYVTNSPSNVTVLATQNARPDRAFVIKHNTLGYVYVGDSGFIAGSAINNDTTIWPAKITTAGVPQSKNYIGGTVYNSAFYANMMTWAFDYVMENIDVNYNIP